MRVTVSGTPARRTVRTAKILRVDGSKARITLRSTSGRSATDVQQIRARNIESSLGGKLKQEKGAKRRGDQPRVRTAAERLVARRSSVAKRAF
jgi:hypothetical protein